MRYPHRPGGWTDREKAEEDRRLELEEAKAEARRDERRRLEGGTFDELLAVIKQEVKTNFPPSIGMTVLDVDLGVGTAAVNLWIIMRILRALWERK